MANTTNYNWETPDDTDLVKDGAAAIRTLGSSIDTTTKALNPSTTLGDIEYRSATANTNTRLPLGTAGQVLKVNSGATAPEWATDASGMTNPMTTTGDTIYSSSGSTPARLAIGSSGNVLTVAGGVPTWAAPAGGGSLRLITRTSFSNVASQTFDSVFSSTYKAYQIVFEKVSATTATDDLHLQLRYSTTTETGGYYNSAVRLPYNSATWTNVGASDAAFVLLSQNIGDTGYAGTYGIMYAFNIGNGSSQPSLIADTVDVNNFGAQYRISSFPSTERSYTGFLLKSSSTNITGTVAVYGLATS